MARRPITTYEVTDDIDGTPIDPSQAPYTFYDPSTGRALAIDLSPANADKLAKALDALAFFVGHAHKSGSANNSTGKGGARYDRAELTAWAESKGYTVNARGRVPKAIEDEYLASR